MKQMSLGESGFERKTKRTRKREFLDEMNLVVPWAELVSLITPHAPAPGAKGGRPPFAVETMLRIHFLQQWFNLSDPAMEEALYDMALFREMVKEVLDTMISLAEDGMTMLCVTHEMGFARSVADRVIFMADGKILEQAPPQQFFGQPQHDNTRQFLGQILTSHHAH